jgi:leader peptidase (prepilin peptidase) / N-methyltransferase
VALIEALQSIPVLFVALAIILGLLVGSFLNVVIHRLPKMMENEWRVQCAELASGTDPAPAQVTNDKPIYNLVIPRSACPDCGHQITAIENIPIVSYLALGGKCRGCKRKISPRYPIVEGLTALLSGMIAWHFGFGLAGISALILLWGLIALTFIDADTQLLPDSITLPLLWLGLIVNIDGTFTDLRSALLGAVFGYLALWSVYWIFKLVTKKEGMGYGDFKLLAAIGAWLGWQVLPIVILLSSVVGAVVGIVLILLARLGRNIPLPFGPYLAMAGFIALIWGQPIMDSYLRGFQ